MPWVFGTVGQPVTTGQLFRFDPPPPNTLWVMGGEVPPEPAVDGPLEPPADDPPEEFGTWWAAPPELAVESLGAGTGVPPASGFGAGDAGPGGGGGSVGVDGAGSGFTGVELGGVKSEVVGLRGGGRLRGGGWRIGGGGGAGLAGTG